jgi:hypothetical protein
MERLQAMVQTPLQKGTELLKSRVPTSWRDCCAQRVRKAMGLIEMIKPAVMTRDRSFKDCQDYLLELVMAMSGAIMSLRLANNDFNSNQADQQTACRSPGTREARALALQLRQEHLSAVLGNTNLSAHARGSQAPDGMKPQGVGPVRNRPHEFRICSPQR